jgi:alpha-ribazole phosphatase
MYYGHTDYPLADEGVKQIKALTRREVYPRPEKAVYYSSGLTRAEQTMSLIYGDTPRVRLPALKEMNFGEYEQKKHEDLLKDPVYISWIEDPSGSSAPPGGESLMDFKERVRVCFDNILNSDEEHSVVVCHGGVICVVMASCFDDDYNNMFDRIPEPGHGYTVTVEEGLTTGYAAF